MSMLAESAVEEEEEVEEEEQQERNPEPVHHPTAPSDELFDISTTVDPSYIISLIRKLLPPNDRIGDKSPGVDSCDASAQGSKADGSEESSGLQSQNGALNEQNGEFEAMDTVEHTSHEKPGSVGEDAWEEYGCILWDLAASKTHAEFMVQNLVLEVLLANLKVPRSVRVTEIILGIIGNLACHEVSRKHIASTSGLVEAIVDQLFSDDTPCLCEACRVITLGLQGSECITWTEALRLENVLSRVLWVAENALNPQLIEKSVGLLLAILESEQKVVAALLPNLMQLGLSSLLINLLTFEMSKLAGERVPERYCVLDSILRTIEALSVIDDCSQEVSCNRELFRLLIDLVKISEKIEVANSCVTAAVLIANMLTDNADLALELSQGKVFLSVKSAAIVVPFSLNWCCYDANCVRISSDIRIHPDLAFLQGLFDVFPFASDDIEARSALWSIIARLLVQVQESEMSLSTLHQFVSVFVTNLERIEDELLDNQLDNCKAGTSSRTTALRKILSISREWTALKDSIKESNIMVNNHSSDETVDRLLERCRKYIQKLRSRVAVHKSTLKSQRCMEAHWKVRGACKRIERDP